MENCKLNEVEDIIASLYEEDNFEVYEIPYEDDMQIVVDGIRIVIPELELSAREGNVCIYDPDEECYMPDFSISLLYEKDEKDPSKYLYWEQDGIEVTLYNYLHEKKLSMDDIGNFDCEIEVELAGQA